MKRGYDIAFFKAIMKTIHRSPYNFSVGTDIICGFPTETEQQFSNSMQFAEDMGFSYIHAFSYSSRPGTAAYRRFGHGDRETAKKRVRLMRQLGEKLKYNFENNQIGRNCTVLVEDNLKGLTETFIQVEIKGEKRGALVECRLEKKQESPLIIKALSI